MVTEIRDTINLDKHGIVRSVLYTKLVEKNICMSDNDLGVFSLFADTEDNDEVISKALEMGYIKNKQTGENIISRLVSLELLEKKDKKKRTIPQRLFPSSADTIRVTLKMYNG